MRKALFTISLFIASVVSAQEASDILKEHFKDYGQQDWNEIKMLTVEGNLIDSHFGRWPMQLIYKGSDRIKIVGKYKGQQYAEAFDGTTAWIKAPWKAKYEVERMSAEEELIIRHSFSIGSPLYLIRDHLTFQGLMDMEGELYYAFTMSEASYEKTYYLGREDYRLYFEQINTKFGTPISVLKVFEKYKEYGSILVPTAVIFEGTDLEKELTFDGIYLGMGAKDEVFKMPKRQ